MPKIVFSTYSGKCKGTTQTGASCKHIVVFANGLCRQHGGVSPPMEVPTFEEIRDKTVARLKITQAKAKARAEKNLAKWRAMLNGSAK